MSRFMVLALFALVSLFVTMDKPVHAQSPVRGVETMSVANGLYADAEFQQAARLYQQLVDEGFRDSSLYFNLGNSYYKQGDLGRAIANYLRAQRLTPRDPEIIANLEIARGQASDRSNSGDDSTFELIASVTHRWLTLNELALITLGLWCLFIVVAATYILARASPRRVMLPALVVSCIVFVAGASAFSSHMYVDLTDKVVVVANTVDVSAGPGDHYDNQFTLRSGAEARLLETRGRWVHLEMPGGQRQGWVSDGAVERIAMSE